MVWVWVWVCGWVSGWGWGLRFGSGVSAGGVSLRLEACPAAGAGSFGAGRGLPAWRELFRRGRVLRLGRVLRTGKGPLAWRADLQGWGRRVLAALWARWAFRSGRRGFGLCREAVAGRRGLGGACHRWWTARVGSGGTV